MTTKLYPIADPRLDGELAACRDLLKDIPPVDDVHHEEKMRAVVLCIQRIGWRFRMALPPSQNWILPPLKPGENDHWLLQMHSALSLIKTVHGIWEKDTHPVVQQYTVTRSLVEKLAYLERRAS